MKTLWKPTLAVWALGLALVLPVNARAQSFMGGWNDKEHRKEKMERRIQQVYDQLGLSAEQKHLLKENKKKHKAAAEALSKDLKAAMEAMGEEMKKQDLDLGKINALRVRFKVLRDQMADERFNAVLEVRKILTREQFVKFTDLLQQQKDAD